VLGLFNATAYSAFLAKTLPTVTYHLIRLLEILNSYFKKKKSKLKQIAGVGRNAHLVKQKLYLVFSVLESLKCFKCTTGSRSNMWSGWAGDCKILVVYSNIKISYNE